MLKFVKDFFRKKNLLNRKKPYSAMLSWVTNDLFCNLDCQYCLFSHIEEKIPPLDVDSLLNTINKTGNIFKILLTGSGEPFIVPNILEVCQKITHHHYLELVSNLTSNKFEEFCKVIDPQKVVKIVASLHIKELERRKLTDRYIKNYTLIRKKRIPIEARVVAHPSLFPEIDYYRDFFKKKGITIFFDEFQGQFDGKEYPRAYTRAERELLGFESFEKTQQKHYQKGKLCNSGYNSGIITSSGNIYPCFLVRELLGDIKAGKLNFKEELLTCPIEFCICPINILNPELFGKALREKGYLK